MASSGTPSCVNPQTSSVTLTVLPLPTVSVSVSPTTLCSGSTATFTFTGTSNATVTYNINGGANQTIVLNGAGTATLTGTYTANTTVNIVSAASAGTPSCVNPQTSSVTLTVLPLPTVSVSVSPTTLCSGDSATFTFTGTPNATVTYNINGGATQTIVLNGTGTATLTGTYTANTTVNIVSVASSGTPSCVNPQTSSGALTILPLPTVSVSVSPTTLCSGSTATFTFTGTPNATITYNINGGASQTIVLNGTGTATLTGTYTANTTVNIISVASSGTPSCVNPQTSSITLTIQPLPTASVSVSPTPICSGDSATFTFTGTPNATVTYNINGGANQTIVLNGTGTATLTGTYTANTTVNIVSVASSGTPSCVNSQTSSVTLTIQPLPTASVSVSPTTLCSGDSATFTFTGTPNATVTYNINGGANQTIVLNGTGTATLTGTYTANTTVNIVSVASSGTPSCVNPQTSSVTLTIQPLPTVSVSVSPTTLCSGDSATFTFTGTPNATVTYNINGGANQTIILNGTGTATLTGTYTANTTVNIVSVASSGTPSCVNPQASSVTLTIQPLPIVSVSVSPTTLCSGDSATFTFTGTPNATVTYNINGGANQTITLNGTGTATLTGTYTANTTVNIVSVASSGTPSCVNPQTSSVTLTVLPLPTVSVSVSPTTLCSGDSATFTFTGTPNATVTYNINGGANQTIVLNGTGTATLTGTYTANTTVNIVSVASSGTPSCVNPQTSSTTLTVVEPPIVGANASTTICILNPSFDLFPLLGPTAQLGGTWSPALASGTGVFNPTVDPAGTYTYTILGTTPCPPASASVEVIVNPIPDAGSDGTLTICSNQNSVDLFASLLGTPQLGGTWSPALASGTGIFNPAVDASGVYTYTITGVAPCVDDIATVSVTVTPGPEAGSNNSITLCVNSSVQDLALLLGPNSQPGGVWSPAMASGTGVFNPAVDPQGDYTYTLTGTQPCDNDFAVITVTVNPVPDAGNDNLVAVCSNGTAQDLFLLLGVNAQAGGTWSPALASGTGVFNPTIDVAGTYTYSVGGGFCSTDTADVIVTIIQAANSGGVGQTLNVCVTSTSVDLFAGLDGTQGTGTWNDDNGTGAMIANVFNPSTVGVGTYNFTYTVVGTSPCANSSSTVTVIVNPQPNAGTFTGIVSLCPSVGVLDLATLLTGQNSGGVWTDSSALVVTSPITIINFAPGTYSYTYSVTNACTTDTEVVQFTILANPIISTVNVTISPACLGSNAIVNLNGMVDGTYTLSYDLSGANILSGQTATVTITSGIGNFSIPTASLPNIGTTVIMFTNILNTVTNCSTSLTNVATQIQVRPLADIDSANLSAANVCFGNSLVVNIANAVNLPDGVYQFNYSIPNATPTTGVTGNVTVTGGIGQFTVPASIFTVAGNYTLTIIGIIATTGCTNANENATVSFVINPIPSLTTASVTVQDTCANFTSLVTISGATDLPNGDYTITYQLTGANTALNTITVTFTGGTATFSIPATDLINNGSTILTINQLNSIVTNCGVAGNVVNPINFNVTLIGTPQIIQDGNLFCQDDNPTIETLTANLIGFPTVIWYNAPTGGTAYASTDLLVNGTTYYAALIAASGCEGAIRLEVTVDTTVCDDLFIPDGYSPNNDGINDTFEIPNLALLYPNFKLEIYNRYGNLIYTGNRNTPNWDGTTTVSGLNLGNNLLPVGVYFYILNFNDGIREAIQGRVYLNR
ncbi:beta strand repeat-containing protein [Flavobacterium sp. UBA7682]|uniref:beta strand repeat-containing protein n=1 Tax=Flavobacterium sp. UBA7682 TaxID=1946560 RepID=UPI0025BCE367|nr:gliding motility-associated C-terminal domain-containing protein [Flavobacterium sp. UBA7682]